MTAEQIQERNRKKAEWERFLNDGQRCHKVLVETLVRAARRYGDWKTDLSGIKALVNLRMDELVGFMDECPPDLDQFFDRPYLSVERKLFLTRLEGFGTNFSQVWDTAVLLRKRLKEMGFLKIVPVWKWFSDLIRLRFNGDLGVLTIDFMRAARNCIPTGCGVPE